MEKISKNKGRPSKIPNIIKVHWRSTNQDPKITDRSINNKYYLTSAFRLLKKGHPYFVNNTIIYHETILYALGRIAEKYGDDVTLILAQEIEKKKMKTAEALRLIKRYRIIEGENLQKNKVEGVLNKIINTVNSAGLTEKEMIELIKDLGEVKIKMNEKYITGNTN